MRELDKGVKKTTVELRKHSLSEKTRSDYSSPFAGKDELPSPFLGKVGKTLGRKYMQDNLFKAKEKQHHEIVISDEVVRSSKLFRMLKEKMVMRDAIFVKECNQIADQKQHFKQQVAAIKTHSASRKAQLWELKNQILELKSLLNDQQQESRRLQREIEQPEGHYVNVEEEEEMEPGGEFSVKEQEGASMEDLGLNNRCLSDSFKVEGNPELEEDEGSRKGSEY